MTVPDASDDDASAMLTSAVPASRQKCATIVEEAETDDLDDDRDNNGYGTEGRTVVEKQKKLVLVVFGLSNRDPAFLNAYVMTLV